MEVKLFANLVEIAGQRTVTVDPDEATTGSEALERVFDIAPELREEVLGDDGAPCEHINVLVNGTNVTHTEAGLDGQLEPSDEIAIFPPVSGG